MDMLDRLPEQNEVISCPPFEMTVKMEDEQKIDRIRFKISEEDLRLRGPGDFFGSRQHGLPEMHVADLGADVNVLKSAQDEAQRLLKDDPALTKPEHRALRERIDRLFSANSDSFN